MLQEKKEQGKDSIVLGGGCFWCIEAIFNLLKGVDKVTSGYAGGHTDNPTYAQVSGQKSGHAEVIKIDFDINIIQTRQILEIFFTSHDPTTPNRQGNDTGPEYRSIVLYKNEEQKILTENIIKELEEASIFENKIVTEIKKLEKFYEAESEHKDYYNKNQNNPYCTYIISPKIKKFKEKFKNLLK